MEIEERRWKIEGKEIVDEIQGMLNEKEIEEKNTRSFIYSPFTTHYSRFTIHDLRKKGHVSKGRWYYCRWPCYFNVLLSSSNH